MDIEKTLDVLLNPKYLRPIILAVGIIVLFRNLYYLVLSDVTQLFKFGAQPTVEMTLGAEVPMLLMTVLWPVIFAFLNRVHESMKINKYAFYGIILVHLVTCLISAYLIHSEGCLPPECKQQEFNSVVWGGSILTFVSVAFSYWLYNATSLFTVPAEAPNKSSNADADSAGS